MLSEQEVLDRLREAIRAAGSQRALARQLGLSVAYINDVLHGRRALADKILDAIGCERVIVHQVLYREKAESERGDV